jgi:hypothetical protein
MKRTVRIKLSKLKLLKTTDHYLFFLFFYHLFTFDSKKSFIFCY